MGFNDNRRYLIERKKSMYKFVEEGFKAPFEVSTSDYHLRKLRVDDVEKDYQAVMSSKESLRQIFCVDDDWPADDMTIEKNYQDLKEHQDEFDNNEGFAYTIELPDKSKCIGCLYIFPFSHGVYDSCVYYWLIDELDNQLNSNLREFTDKWLEKDFDLINPAYPGRDFTHLEWERIVEEIKSK